MKKYYIILIVIIIIILSVFVLKMKNKNKDDKSMKLVESQSEIKVEEENGFYRVLKNDEIVYEGNDIELLDLYENDPDFDLKMPEF